MIANFDLKFSGVSFSRFRSRYGSADGAAGIMDEYGQNPYRIQTAPEYELLSVTKWSCWRIICYRRRVMGFSLSATVDRLIDRQIRVKSVDDQSPHVRALWKIGEWGTISRRPSRHLPGAQK
ncbi:hypothetical protein TNCV_4430931 [Trichonephila clavipes]|nr:hypothetical protein TNCV_4430931 [Trichonephila clavipes]